MQSNYILREIKLVLTSLVVVLGISCDKLVDVEAPVTSLNAANVYTNDASAISVVTSMYKNMTRGENFTGLSGISLRVGLSADELTLYSGVTNERLISYYQNSLKANSTRDNFGSEYWNPFYNYIFVCNAAIEGIGNSNTLTPAIKKQLLGETKFMRAFINFYLINLFGDVPIVVSTDWEVNANLSRTPRMKVYEQVIADLEDAQELLSADYLDGTVLRITEDRLRPTKWAAIALMSRVYLYTGDYSKAESHATEIINHSSVYRLTDLNSSFLMNAAEAIWQLQPTFEGHNTEDALVFVIPTTGPTDAASSPTDHPVYLSSSLLNSFELGDKRRINWVDSVIVSGSIYYYPFKYKSASLNEPLTEYLMVLRLGEQYLIRAEARVQQNNINGAQEDLNVIRGRAGLGNSAASDRASLFAAILHERQVELFTEWGHRWLDLKRTGTIDAVMSAVTPQKANGAPWRSFQQWYPLPFVDIQRGPNLVQNNGY